MIHLFLSSLLCVELWIFPHHWQQRGTVLLSGGQRSGSIKGGREMFLVTSSCQRPHEQVCLLVPKFSSATFCICLNGCSPQRKPSPWSLDSLHHSGGFFCFNGLNIINRKHAEIPKTWQKDLTASPLCVQENVCSPPLYADAASGAVCLRRGG